MKPVWHGPIDTIKGRVYMFVLPAGALLSFGLWWLEARSGSLHVIDLYGLPLFGLLCLSLFLALRRWPKNLFVYELMLFCTFTALYLASLGYSLSVLAHDSLGLWNLAGLTYWGPVLYMVAFLVFGVRQGLYLSLGLHAIFGFAVMSYFFLAPSPGATAMLMQGFTSGVLVLFLLWAIGNVVASQARSATRFEREASTDPLTLLSNRRQMWRQLELEQERSERFGNTFCLAFLDLDFFKRVNDLHGHAMGDKVLTEVSQVLSAQTRTIDVVGRWGGEEFLLLLPGLTLEESKEAVERLRQVVSAHRFSDIGTLTVSAGVAAYVPTLPLDDLLARADRALYRAKEAGRNQVVIEWEADVQRSAVVNDLLN